MIGMLVAGLLFTAQVAPVAPTPGQFADALQYLVGTRYDAGVTITRIAAERQTLVIVLDGPPGWRETMSSEQVSETFMASFCGAPDFDYFVNGNRLRVDTIEQGDGLRRGPTVEHCAPTERPAG